jgi:hypothetical protein
MTTAKSSVKATSKVAASDGGTRGGDMVDNNAVEVTLDNVPGWFLKDYYLALETAHTKPASVALAAQTAESWLAEIEAGAVGFTPLQPGKPASASLPAFVGFYEDKGYYPLNEDARSVLIHLVCYLYQKFGTAGAVEAWQWLTEQADRQREADRARRRIEEEKARAARKLETQDLSEKTVKRFFKDTWADVRKIGFVNLTKCFCDGYAIYSADYMALAVAGLVITNNPNWSDLDHKAAWKAGKPGYLKLLAATVPPELPPLGDRQAA